MTKTLLRSGDLDDFQAVGGGGQAVFDSALQIRETLRLRKQLALVDCLAIPQVNDENDRVAWYAPIEGKAVAWKAADEGSRERALRFLHSTFDSALALSRKSLQSGKTAQQLFGALLEKALQFPGENHVYLVDGKPVITFWGFINLNENIRDAVLDCLRLPEPEPIIEQLPEPVAEAVTEPVMFTDGDKPLFTPVSLPEPPFTPVDIAEPEAAVA
ncbi:SrfA family protein, partial [Trabulsiella odontotermitis]